MNRISRFGSYGVLLQDSAILLNRKRSGSYKGLWDLSGGAIRGNFIQKLLSLFFDQIRVDVIQGVFADFSFPLVKMPDYVFSTFCA